MKPSVGLSAFVDFCLAHGRERVRIVREIRDGADSKFDLYAPLRRAIVDMHAEQKVLDPTVLDQVRLASPSEHRHFPPCIAGHKKFLAKNSGLVWFEPPLRDYPIGPIAVRIDPEIGLIIDRKPHVLKMYLRRTTVEKLRVELLTTLMEMAMRATWPSTTFGVLDVRRGRFHAYKPASIPNTKANVVLGHAEAAAFGSLWTSA